MPIDKEKFATYLRGHSATASTGNCAAYVRKALEAGGASTIGHPTHAKDYDQILVRNGYREYSPPSLEAYAPIKGDIAIIQPTSKGRQSGHIEGYDGSNWVSDFVQSGFWPGPAYRKETPNYVIYRP